MRFPFTSSTRIQQTSGGNPKYEAIYHTSDGSGILFHTPLDGTIELRKDDFGDGPFWILVYQPVGFSAPNVPGWVAPIPTYLTITSLQIHTEETFRRQILRQLLTDHQHYIGGSISVELVDDSTGESVGHDTISLSDLGAVENHIYENFWDRGVSFPIQVTATQFVALLSGSAGFQLGMVFCENGFEGDSYWLDATAYFQRMCDYENFSDMDESSFPYVKRDPVDASSHAAQEFNVGKLVRASGTYPILHLQGGLQRLHLQIPMNGSMELPIGLVYFSEQEGSEPVLSVRVSGAEVSGFSLAVESSTVPIAVAEPLHIRNDDLQFDANRRDVMPRTGTLTITSTAGEHRIRFRMVDNIIERIFQIAVHVDNLLDSYARWTGQEAVSGVTNQQAVEYFLMLKGFLDNDHVSSQVKEMIRDAIRRNSSSLYIRIFTRVETLKNQLTGNISTSRNSIANQMFGAPFFRDQLIANPTGSRLEKYFYVLQVLGSCSQGQELLQNQFSGFMEGEIPADSHGIGYNDIGQIIKKSGELASAGLAIWMLKVRIGLRGKVRALARGVSGVGNNLSTNPEFTSVIRHLDDHARSLGMNIEHRIRVGSDGREVFEITDLALLSHSEEASRLLRLTSRASELTVVFGLCTGFVDLIANPSLRSLGDWSANAALFTLNIVEAFGDSLSTDRRALRWLRNAQQARVGSATRLGGIAVTGQRVLGVVTAGFDLYSYYSQYQSFSSSGDEDAEMFAVMGGIGSSTIIVGELMTCSVVLAPVGAVFIGVGAILDISAAIGIASTADSQLSLILQYSIFGTEYEDVAGNDRWRALESNTALQGSYLLSEFFPITGRLTYNPSRTAPLYLIARVTKFSIRSRVYLQFLTESGTSLQELDFQLLLDEDYQFLDRSYQDLNSWLRIYYSPPSSSHPGLGLEFRLGSGAPFDGSQVAVCRLVVSCEDLPDTPGNRYIPTNEFVLHFTHCTRGHLILEDS